MNDYLIIRLINDKSLYFPYSVGYGDVEIRSNKPDFPEEKKLLEQSANSFGETINLQLAPRILTIINADAATLADNKAEIKFEQVLDVFDIEAILGRSYLYNCGCIENLTTKWRSARFAGKSLDSTAFIRQNTFIPKINFSQAIFNFTESELKTAILRSYHWTRKAKLEPSIHMKCLFYWFAIEALTKLNREDITWKIMVSMGFPEGKVGRRVTKSFISSLKDDPNYNSLKNLIKKRLKEINKLRDQTVHSGWRSWEITESELNNYYSILSMSVPRLQNYAIQALSIDICTVQELWEYIDIIYLSNENLENDLKGTVLFSIKEGLSITYNGVCFAEE